MLRLTNLLGFKIKDKIYNLKFEKNEFSLQCVQKII